MGRTTPTNIKRAGKELMEKYKTFTKNFDENKKFVDAGAEVQTKKLRNRIAGYITRKIKNYKEIKLD